MSQAHLVPTDEISVYYHCQPEGDYLNSVVQTHTDFIMGTTKAPLLPFPVPKSASVIISEKTQVWWTNQVSQTDSFSSVIWTPLKKIKFWLKSFPFFRVLLFNLKFYWCLQVLFLWQLKNSDLELTIVKGSSAQAPLNGPACSYVNLRLNINNKEKGRSQDRSI